MACTSEIAWGSARTRSMVPSCLHEMFRSVEEYERTNKSPVIRLHVGEPHFKPSPKIVEALVLAVREHRTTYTSAEGLLELRTVLVKKLEEHNRINTSVDKVFVCPGSTQGLATLMQAIADPGTELLLPKIHWPIYLQQCLLAGLQPVFYPLRSDYSIDPEAIASVATARTRVLLVNSPANPTGAICDTRTLAALLELARARGWNIISDEAYEDFVYDGQHVSIATLEREIKEKERCVFSVFTFSKSYAMTGYRIGYIVAPHAAAARAVRVVQEASIVAPSTPVQFAALAALATRDEVHEARRCLLEARNRILPALIQVGLLRSLPQGGWYALLDICGTGLTADQLAVFLLSQRGVAVAPASGFALRTTQKSNGMVTLISPDPAARHLVRIAFCGDPAHLEEGILQIKSLLTENENRKVERYDV